MSLKPTRGGAPTKVRPGFKVSTMVTLLAGAEPMLVRVMLYWKVWLTFTDPVAGALLMVTSGADCHNTSSTTYRV